MFSLGVRYLLRLLPVVLLLPISTALFLYAIRLELYSVVHVLLSLLSLPIGVFFLVQWNDYKDQRQANKFNAVLPPRVEDSSLGGINTMLSMVDNFQRGYLGDNLAEWARKHGPVFNIRIMFENRMFTTEPDHIRSILATNFAGFEKGSHFRFQFDSLLGKGVFNADGDLWKFHRGISRPFFTKDRISDFQGYARHSDRALSLLAQRLQEGFPVDFQDLASRYTLDWTTEFLFGADAESLSSTLPYPGTSGLKASQCHSVSSPADLFARSFVDAQSQTSLRTRYGPAWPLLELGGDKVKRHMSVVYNFVVPIIQKAIDRNRDQDSKKAEWEQSTLLDYLVQQTDDMTILRDETLNMLIAGRDTTTCLLTSTIYALAENPSVLLRLRTEIIDALGTTGIPTIQDLRALKYLHAVLNEALRLWPPVPINIRKSKETALWSPIVEGGKPFCVPARTKCSYSVLLMHRRTDLWGPDAEKYDPDRFLDERYERYLAPNPLHLSPLQYRPSNLHGTTGLVAYDEASFFLVKLLQMFSEISLAPEAQPVDSVPPWKNREKVWFTSHVSMYFKGGVWVKMAKSDLDV
ncbi:Cytochrome P450 monooxygenase pc-3 [Mycena venus]|uniref:Cytochrome P450 monooxygenase pc-3 n=1 Tax=Mycena venus TaxID=2733690 RepID=A0A8H7D8C3_9AGAR|nr:Cytochrome P450 monooxygenase pc-3 [Mycena venus]